MQAKPTRHSIDLSPYPDLVVVYLGYRVSTWRGFLALLGIGRALRTIAREKPDGLLAHESMLFSPLHIGIRQYWRDLESLEAFTRTGVHKTWWKEFGLDSKGAGFWHETYRKAGGMEAIYLGMPPIGFASFAPARRPEGPFNTARERLAA